MSIIGDVNVLRSAKLLDWLHQLDSYTNAEFGLSRTLSITRGVCVACGGDVAAFSVTGLCEPCTTKRRPDYTELQLFRPLRPVPGP